MARIFDKPLTAVNLPVVLPEDVPDYEALQDAWVAKKSAALIAAVQAIAQSSTGGGSIDPSPSGGTTTSEVPISINNSTTRRAAVPNAVSQNVARPATNSLSFQSVNGSTGDAQFPITFDPGKVTDVVWEAPGFGTGLMFGSGSIILSAQAGSQTDNAGATNGVVLQQNDQNGRLIFRAGGTNNYYITQPIPNTANLRLCLYGKASTTGILPYYSTDGGATWKSDFMKDGVTPLAPIVLPGTLYLSFFSQASQTLSQNITVGVDAAISGVTGGTTNSGTTSGAVSPSVTSNV